MRTLVFEVFKDRVIAQHHPAEDSPIGLKLREADDLEARRAALQPDYTAAVERVREIEMELYRPRPSIGAGVPAAKLEMLLAEYRAAKASADEIAAELSALHLKVQSIQIAIIDMLHPAAVDDAARAYVRRHIVGRPA